MIGYYVSDSVPYFEKDGGNNASPIFTSCAMEETTFVWLVSHMPENTPECWAPVVENL